MSAGLSGYLFLNSLCLQQVRHFSPLPAGLLLMPSAGGQLVGSLLAGRIVAARGTRLPLVLGGVLMTAGGFLLVPLSGDTTIGYLLAACALFGLGVGMISPSVTNTAVSGMPRDQAGVAGALIASGRQFGASIGIAIVGAIIAGSASGFLGASRSAWAVLGACGVVCLALGVVSTSGRAKAAALLNGRRLTVDQS